VVDLYASATVEERHKRVCAKCGVRKPISEYGEMARHKGVLSKTCKACIRSRQREWEIKRQSLFDARAIDKTAKFRCAICKKSKLAADFPLAPTKKNGIAYRCKECIRAYDRRRYDADPQKHRDVAKWRMLKCKFGLTKEQWMTKFDAQGGKCAICFRDMSELPLTLKDKRGACVDHDHETGKIRDLLCSRCNQGIGLLGDDPSLVERAAAYLRKHKDGQ
jgi:hypothetical protein